MKVHQQLLVPLNWPGCQQESLLPRRVRTTRKAHAAIPTCERRTPNAAFAGERSSETGFRSKKNSDIRRKYSTLTSTPAKNPSSTFAPFRSSCGSGRNSPRLNLVQNIPATDISETLHRLLVSGAQHQQIPYDCERQDYSANYTFRYKRTSACGRQRNRIFARTSASVSDQKIRESAGQTDGSAGTPIDGSDSTALTISSIQQNQFDSMNACNVPAQMEAACLDHLADLRHEAYQDLALSTQTYNDSIVNRMRYLETLSCEDQRAILHGDSDIWMPAEEFHNKDVPVDVDVDVDALITLMGNDAAGIKDYGELLEFERGVIGHNVDEANWVGYLW